MKKKNKKNLSVPGVELFRDVCLLIHGDETKNRNLIERNKMKIWKRREGKLVFSLPSPLVLSDYRKKERTRKIKRIKERKTLCSAYFDLLFKIKICIYTDRYILFSIFKIFFPSFFLGKIFYWRYTCQQSWWRWCWWNDCLFFYATRVKGGIPVRTGS